MGVGVPRVTVTVGAGFVRSTVGVSVGGSRVGIGACVGVAINLPGGSVIMVGCTWVGEGKKVGRASSVGVVR